MKWLREPKNQKIIVVVDVSSFCFLRFHGPYRAKSFTKSHHPNTKVPYVDFATLMLTWLTFCYTRTTYSTGHFIMDFIFSTKKVDWLHFFTSQIYFFQYTDTELRLKYWKTCNWTIFSSRVSNSISELLKGPTRSWEFFLLFFLFTKRCYPNLDMWCNTWI